MVDMELYEQLAWSKPELFANIAIDSALRAYFDSKAGYRDHDLIDTEAWASLGRRYRSDKDVLNVVAAIYEIIIDDLENAKEVEFDNNGKSDKFFEINDVIDDIEAIINT